MISGNGTGIQIRTSASGTMVQNNYIGLNAAGTQPISNGTGISINNNATGNTIGGTAAGAGNVISGNTGSGINIQTGANGDRHPGQPDRPRCRRQRSISATPATAST